jgi:radical SAM superfamily enzyme YgiQ (UPF0313 family)
MKRKDEDGVAMQEVSVPRPYRRLIVILIRTSKYDDDGYVVRHWRGTLPSNTLSCLNSLTEDAVRSGELGPIEVRVDVIDEIVTRVDPRALGRRYRRDGTKVVVGLVGVQTNQFPRAQDLARQFKAQGFDVIIGGFHVSGAMAMSPATPPECQEMLDAGVTLVLGEVEGRWGAILRDALEDRLQPRYDYLPAPPDLTDMPLPRAARRTQRRFVLTHSGTIDAGRGCPFSCSFCTIINVQGRRMRSRSASRILDRVRENYWLKGRRGVRHYFFTDDNFVRNPQWEAIFDGLIRMREEEGLLIDFMMQVDVQAPRVPGFVEKAARAGCVQVFIGMESVRDDNLQAGGKPQNRVADYRDMIARWHEVGVVCHVGYIIGFPCDTYERVMADVRTLRETLHVDQASFFMLAPIPGSRDHATAVREGTALDPDYNNYDSFHATAPHPRMSRQEWERAFRDAWVEFYSFDSMRRSLLAQNPHTYWAVLKNLMWYRAAMIEGAHPMITGFFRLKDRRSRRPSFPIERRGPFIRRRVREVAHVLREYLKLYVEMQQLWLLTRIRREDYWFLGDLRGLGPRSVQAMKLAWGRVHAAVAERLASAQQRLGVGADALSATMRQRLDAVGDALGSRAALLRGSMGEHAGAARSHVDEAMGSTSRRLVDGMRAVRTALADLQLPELPAARPPSSFMRWATRVNPFSLDRLEYDPALAAYWRRTRHAAARLEWWRLNPALLTWNAVRATRQALGFLVALRGERY